MTTRLIACIAATALAFGGVAGVAGARAKHRDHHAKWHTAPHPGPSARAPASKSESFDGSCEFSGAVTFTPPMTSSPQPVAQHADALGTCTGAFVDQHGRTHQLDAAASRYMAESSGDQVSCAFGLASGSGTLSLPDGQIDFAMSEYRGGATPLLRLTGEAGGEAWMPVTPSQSSDPVAAVEACNGSGLAQFDLDAHMQTTEALRG